jgi:hypothetical protein
MSLVYMRLYDSGIYIQKKFLQVYEVHHLDLICIVLQSIFQILIEI